MYSDIKKIETNKVSMKITISLDEQLERTKALASENKEKKNEEIIDEALNSLFKEEYSKACAAERIDPVAIPEIMDISGQPLEENVTFEVHVIVRPEVTVEYKGLTAKIIKKPVTDEEVQMAIEDGLRKHTKEIDVKDRAVENGDIVTFDYKGFCEGEQFEGGTAEDQQLLIGSGMFIPGFEEQMVGKEIGENFTVSVTFPEQYPAPNLAGKPATFECVVHAITVQEIPELTDEFVKEVAGCENVEVYMERARQHVQRMADMQAEENAVASLLDQIIDNLEGEIPEVMYDNEAEQIIAEFAGYLAAQGYELDTYLKNNNQTIEQFREEVRPDAIKRVKMSLAVGKVALAEKVIVTDEEFRMNLEPTARAYGVTVDEILEKSDKGRLMQIKSSLLIKKTMYAVFGYAEKVVVEE